MVTDFSRVRVARLSLVAEEQHVSDILMGRRRDPPPRGVAWEPLGVTHLESREISRTKGP
jgi:hypothetical protein